MAKNMTIVEKYEEILKVADSVLTDEQKEFLKERAELTAKKNASRKPTKAQKENEDIKSAILEGMENGVAYTITDLIKTLPVCADLTNQRVSALVRQLKDADLVVRTEEKGKAYFTKA